MKNTSGSIRIAGLSLQGTHINCNPKNGFWLFLKSLFMGHCPETIGEIGEWKMARSLKRLPDDYSVLYDVYLPTQDETTTQIDAVVISEYGIFVIEAKNFDNDGRRGGWIFGNEDSREWCISMKGGTKFRFQNPLRQNYKHVAVLSELLNISKNQFHNVVVFVGHAEFKTTMPEGVVYKSELVPYIRSFQNSVFNMKQMETIFASIQIWAGTISKEKMRSHVDNLKTKHD